MKRKPCQRCKIVRYLKVTFFSAWKISPNMARNPCKFLSHMCTQESRIVGKSWKLAKIGTLESIPECMSSDYAELHVSP